jgi:RNA recognition motif-containing protein
VEDESVRAAAMGSSNGNPTTAAVAPPPPPNCPPGLDYDPACRVFVANVPFAADEAAMYSVMRAFGRVRAITIPRDKETQRASGIAFVDFAEEHDALTARAAPPHHLMLQGRALRTGVPNRQYGVAVKLAPVTVFAAS